jgi:inosine-uridine nucleoside N-ribohydrolase
MDSAKLAAAIKDCSGPGGSNMQTLLTLIQSPQVDVLGITVVSGNRWRDEEVAHTLRLLELIGRTDMPVVPGAVFPLCGTHFSPPPAPDFGLHFPGSGTARRTRE